MAIGPISKSQFETLQPENQPLAKLRLDQHEWFADERGNILGAVVFDPAEEEWGWAALARDPAVPGGFRVVRLQGRLATQDEGRQRLREMMEKLETASLTPPLAR